MYEILIVGGGPAGLTAAIYAARAGKHVAVLERGSTGGQIISASLVENYPGIPSVSGTELARQMTEQACTFGAEIVYTEAVGLEKTSAGFRVLCTDGVREAKTVILATGAAHRRLDLPWETTLTGCGVSYCAVCDGAFYKGKTVAIVGGGDTALGEAVFLSKLAERVYLIHRRDSFRANKSLQEKVSRTENIIPVMSAVPTEIFGDKKVGGIELSRDGNTERLTVDGVFVAVGTVPNSEPLRGVAELTSDGYVIAGEDCVTSAKGIFAAGDVRTKPLRQVITAAADGACCVYEAEKYLEG